MRHLLLLVPCVAALIPWLYNYSEPRLFGLPFFWWFQLGMIPVSAFFILAVYLGDRR